MKLTLNTAIERFKEKTKESAKLSAEGSKYIPGGNSRNSIKVGPHPIYVTHGEGAYVYTVDGVRLHDFHGNFSVDILGHNHPKVREAIEKVLSNGFSFGNPLQYEHRLAQMLCDRIESVEKVVFCCSASEACIASARYARAYTGKDKIAKFEGGYHGMGNDFMFSVHPHPEMLPGLATHPLPVPGTLGVAKFVRENVIILPQNDLESCERILAQNAGDIAGVIVELQTGGGGLIVLDKEFVQGLREITRKLGIVLILDETISLRANIHGMQSLYDVKPDITVMGKTIGGGMPMGAIGGAEKIMCLNESGQVYHSGTHHGHPCCVAAGIATLEVMDEPMYDRINGYGERIKTELNKFAVEKKYPVYLQGIGSHIGFEMVDKPGRVIKSAREAFQFCNEMNREIFNFELINRGFLPMWARGQLATSTPMTDGDISDFITTAKEIMDDMFGDS